MDNQSRPHRRVLERRGTSVRGKANLETARRSKALDIGDLAGHLGYGLKRAQLRVFEGFLHAVAPVRLTPAQFSVLMLLDSNAGRNQTEIAAALGILRPNFVPLLDDLESRGLCKRKRSADDRRSHVLTLTDKGRATLAEAKRLVAVNHEKRLAELLTNSEHAQLLRLLDRLAREL